MSVSLPMAVILAGGRGARLSPLTDFVPKPLLPVGERPAIMHILENLSEEGVKRVLILTGYKGEQFEKTIGESAFGMEMSYLCEKEQVGSAGCVKRAAKLLEEEFFVLCADLYGKRRYADFYAYFKEKKGDAAMLLTTVSSPGEYGIVEVDRSGHILSFAEKPFWSRVFSDKANAGIYLMKKELLALIPENEIYDFGGQFFPLLMKNKKNLYGYCDPGLWRDIGDHSAYLACNLAENGGRSIIREGCSIADRAKIEDSLLFENVTVGEGTLINGAILDRGCVIEENCVIEPGCVLGRNCRVRRGSVLPAGTALPSDTAFTGKGGAVPPLDIKGLFSSPTLVFSEETPKAVFSALGSASASLVPPGGMIGVMSDGKEEAAHFAETILFGICRAREGVDMGEGFFACAGFCAKNAGFALCLFVEAVNEGELRISLFDENGLPPASAFLRALRDAFKKECDGTFFPQPMLEGKSARPFSGFVPLKRSYETGRSYEQAIKDFSFASLKGISVGIGQKTMPQALFARTVLRLGASLCPTDKGHFRVDLSPDGSRAVLYDDTAKLDHWHLSALLLGRAVKEGMKIPVMPLRAPRALFDYARALGAHPVGFILRPENGDEKEKRASAMKLPFLYDGLFAALGGICAAISEKMTCAELLSSLPPFYVLEEDFDCPEEDKLPLILLSGCRPCGEGLDKQVSSARFAMRALEKRGFSLQVEAAREIDCISALEKAKKELRAQHHKPF